MFKHFAIAITLLFSIGLPEAFAQSANSSEFHVSDEVSIAMRTGPGRDYRIKAWLPSGTDLTFLDRNNSTGYVKVRTDRGTEGWIDKQYFSQGPSVKSRLPVVEKQLITAQESLKIEQSKVEELSTQLSQIQQNHVQEVENLNDARAAGTVQLAQLENEITRLQSQIDGMDQTNLMGWFVRGGAVALVGVLIGLLLPNLPKKRRRSGDWF